jgi:hypothetical protein
MNDIRQVTNFSDEVTSCNTVDVSVFVGNSFYITVEYYIIPLNKLTGSSNYPINKLGYICEPRGINYPIMITTGEQQRTIYLGKTGIFEVTPEIFLDINDEGAEALDCTPEITEIRVPKGIPGEEPIKFKLDYVFATS